MHPQGPGTNPRAGRRPPAWPYALLIGLWLTGTAFIVVNTSGTCAAGPPGLTGAAYAGAACVVALAQSVGLFFLLGFVAKSIGYLALPRPSEVKLWDAVQSDRPVVVLYLTAGDLDETAVHSLLWLESSGPKLFLVHDDGDDAACRARIHEVFAAHPNRAGWEFDIWHRPRRVGGKAGAVNWVLERLDPRWEALLLCDNDSIALQGDVLGRALPEFDDPDVAVVQFRNSGFVDPSEPPLQRRLARAVDVFDVFAATQARWGYVPFFGHNGVLRISQLRQAGGLTPGFFSDDLDLSIRLTLSGQRILYRRDIVFAERHPADFLAFRKRARKWAQGCAQVLRCRMKGVLTAPNVPFAQRVGMLEFMSFYPAQVLLLTGLLLCQLIMPWLASGALLPSTFCLPAGVAVLLALLAPTLAWALRHRALRHWPALAWSCVLVYGGVVLPTVRGVLDGLLGRQRPWVPTNLAQARPSVPVIGWGEAALGVLLAAVPWAFNDSSLVFPATYLFVAAYLFSPLTFAGYRGAQAYRAVSTFAVKPVVTAVALSVFALALLVSCAEALAVGARGHAHGAELIVDGRAFQMRGVHYSPWLPGTGPDGKSEYPSQKVVKKDLDAIAALGANTILIHSAPGWVIDLAQQRGLLTVYQFSVSWNDTSREAFDRQADAILKTVETLRRHEGILVWVLGNEVPAWVVERLGAQTVSGRLRDLAERVRQCDPGRLLAHANWPPTKELDLSFLDLACFNLYPAWPYEVSVRGYGPYLREVLGPLALGKPLIISEFGINSLEASEARQAEVIQNCWREIAGGPAAGGIVFSWCDEWWKNFDNPIPGKDYWQREYDPTDAARQDADPEEYYGIVRADRTPKPALAAVREMWRGRPAQHSAVPWIILAAMAAATWMLFGLARHRSNHKRAQTAPRESNWATEGNEAEIRL
ncbi:MAG TPA: glycosyltransferase family 2 protein [Phycisphaerae bacterium]